MSTISIISVNKSSSGDKSKGDRLDHENPASNQSQRSLSLLIKTGLY